MISENGTDVNVDKKQYEDNEEETRKNKEMNSGIPGSVITAKNLDISNAFDIPTGVKTKFVILDKDQKKLASVSSKGLLTAKKPGTVTVTLQQKDGKTWKEIQNISYEIVIPKGSTVNVGTAYYEGQKIDLNTLLKDNDVLHPTTWTTKTKSTIASIDCDTGILTVGTNNGTATVNAVYGTGKNARSVKIPIKINHTNVDISGVFSQKTEKMKFVIKDMSEKKLASVSSKGILTVKKNGSVTVTLQVKSGSSWIDKESKTFQVTNPLSGEIF